MRIIRRIFVGAAVVSLTLAASAGADAAGFAAAHFGGEHGSVVESNPTALYYNPAGIGFSEGIHLYLGGDLALRNATWTHSAPALTANDAPNSQDGNGGKASLFNVFAGPTLAVTAQFGNLVVGAGIFVPFAGRVNWSKDGAFQKSYAQDQTCGDNGACPLAAGGVQRWHMEEAKLTFVSVTAGAAYRLGPLSVGATFNFINSKITESQAHTFSGAIDSTEENTARLDVSGNDLSFGAGLMLEAIPDHLWLAASYQAKPGLGPQRLTGTLSYTNGPAPYYPQTGSTSYDVVFHQTLPDIIRAGIRVRPTDKVELRLFGDDTRWSAMTSQCVNNAKAGQGCSVYPDGSNVKGDVIFQNIPRNWRDTYGVRFGGSYFASPEVEVFAGVGYETGAAPDSTMEPGTMDGDNILASLGGRFFLAKGFHLGASYTQLQFLNRTVTTSELAVKNGTPVQVPTLSQDGNGVYTQWIGIVDVNIEKQF
jgi:long-chain fatty acid transport protein